MKNSLFILFAFITFLGACTKDPVLNDRLVGVWVSEKVVMNSIDITTIYSYEFNLKAGGDVDFTNKSVIQGLNITKDGTWTANEAMQDFTIKFTDGTEETWEVKSLDTENTTLQIEKLSGTEKTTIDLKKN
jgi:hypothetical protein